MNPERLADSYSDSTVLEKAGLDTALLLTVRLRSALVSSLSVLLRFFLGEAEAERGRETLPEEEDRSILVLGVLRRPRGMAEVRGSSEVKEGERERIRQSSLTTAWGAGGIQRSRSSLAERGKTAEGGGGAR